MAGLNGRRFRDTRRMNGNDSGADRQTQNSTRDAITCFDFRAVRCFDFGNARLDFPPELDILGPARTAIASMCWVRSSGICSPRAPIFSRNRLITYHTRFGGRPMSRIIMRRWKSKFARFIQSYGVNFLAVELDVRPTAIYHWIRGATSPRPAHAEVLQRLARERGSRLTMDEIYGHSRTVRAAEIKLATVAPQPAQDPVTVNDRHGFKVRVLPPDL
jgi:hypothetical protein